MNPSHSTGTRDEIEKKKIIKIRASDSQPLFSESAGGDFYNIKFRSSENIRGPGQC